MGITSAGAGGTLCTPGFVIGITAIGTTIVIALMTATMTVIGIATMIAVGIVTVAAIAIGAGIEIKPGNFLSLEVEGPFEG